MKFFKALNGKIHRSHPSTSYTLCGKPIKYMWETGSRNMKKRCRHCWT